MNALMNKKTINQIQNDTNPGSHLVKFMCSVLSFVAKFYSPQQVGL